MPRNRTLAIRQHVIESVEEHPADVARYVAENWSITREAVRQHIVALEREGVLSSSGKTSAKRYTLNVLAKQDFSYHTAGLEEDRVWSDMKPLLEGVAPNIMNICGIAVTEMVNNVIDHSESDIVYVDLMSTAASVSISILDYGVGIFRKIRKACNFAEDREAILELSKGKFTTAPSQHTGYGVFFTSRMMDLFAMHSGRLIFTHEQPDDDWLIETRGENTSRVGTFVQMTIARSTERTASEVYHRFCGDPNDDSDRGFTRTHVPVSLAQYGEEKLVSRSQAKRVLARFEKFSEVLLDFRGVEFIGQAFADEIFRVFRAEHPDVLIQHVHASEDVLRMIHLAVSHSQPRQQTLFQ